MALLVNKRGVAIILVLGAIAILTGLAADFGLNAQVQARLATAERDRLQAEYLARSAVNFLQLLMVKERALKSTISQLSQGAIDPAMPLCKQFPMSTALLRGLFGLTDGAASADEAAPAPQSNELVTAFDTAAASEFLSFRGDFEAECDDESSKFNLNVFAGLKSTEETIGGLNRYDRYKQMLVRFLLTPQVVTLFGDDAEERAGEVVRNIADWVDTDDMINERPGVAGGSELAQYSGRDAVKVRNGKMVTLDEAYLIAGVSDDWFTPLKPYLTVYGGEKINICTAAPPVVEAVIISYAANNQRIPPVSPENRDLLKTVFEGIERSCAAPNASVQQITQVVESILTGQGAPADAAPVVAGQPPPAAAGQAAAGGAFADLIDTATGPFRLIGIGRVGSASREITRRLEVVLNTKDNDPKKWKVLYWKME